MSNHDANILINAIFENQSEKVKNLLKSGIDPNCYEDRDKVRPLHHSIFRVSQAITIMQLLIQSGADPNAQNIEGETPLDWLEFQANPLVKNVMKSFIAQC